MDVGMVKRLLRYPRGSDPYVAGVERFIEFAFKDKPEGTKIHCPCQTCAHTTVQGMRCLGIWCAMGYLKIMMNGVFRVIIHVHGLGLVPNPDILLDCSKSGRLKHLNITTLDATSSEDVVSLRLQVEKLVNHV
jgi:hypothetical protein